jgi:phosphatidylglycerol lysyltransferase
MNAITPLVENALSAPTSSPSPIAVQAGQRVSRETVARFADHPSGYLTVNPEMRHFTAPGIEGFIAYRPFGGVLFQFGGVFAAPADQPRLLEQFRALARRMKKRICAVQIRPADLPLYEQSGFCINQFGASYTLGLAGFKTSGTRFMKMRNKISQARKSGITVCELGVDAPRTRESWQALHSITEAWLPSKGRHAKLLEFLVGELGEPEDVNRRVFIAHKDGRPIAFITYVPSYGRFAGMMHDLSRRNPEAPPGVMELINVTAIERFKCEGIPYLNFGLTPFFGLTPETDCIPGRSKAVSWLLGLLAKYGQAIYPAQSQVNYKLKWNPETIVPEYVAFEGGFRWSMAVRLLLITRAI